MAYIHDLEYYGGNANNQRYLEGLAAAKATSTATPSANASLSPALVRELAAAQALVAQLQADDTASLTDAQAVPVAPENPPTWKAKA